MMELQERQPARSDGGIYIVFEDGCRRYQPRHLASRSGDTPSSLGEPKRQPIRATSQAADVRRDSVLQVLQVGRT